jgi:hypothetical protein
MKLEGLMMSMSKVNDWLQTGASIGVIIGLIMVAYEIRVSNRLGYEQANAERMERWSTLSEIALTTDAVDLLMRAYEGDQLTRMEVQRLGNLEDVFLNTLFYDWTLAQTGTVAFPGDFASFYRDVIQAYLGNEIARRRWETIRTYWRPAFSAVIDTALAAPEQRDMLAEYDFIRGSTDLIE